MEIGKLIEDKTTEIRELRQKLESVESEIERTQGQFPPLWSNDVRELGKFVEDIEEWIRSPKLKRSRQLVDTLKKQASDKRNLGGLPEEYLLDIAKVLESGVDCVLKIENGKLRSGAAKRLLSALLEQAEIADLATRISEYSASFSQLASAVPDNAFSEVVTKSWLESLAETDDFSEDEVDNASKDIMKASGVLNLLSQSGIPAQAYVRAYSKLRSTGEVWTVANRIRELLTSTGLKVSQKLVSPFDGATAIIAAREKALARSSLVDVEKDLTQVERDLMTFSQNLRQHFGRELEKATRLAEFAQIDAERLSAYDELVGGMDICLDIDKIYGEYEKIEHTKREALQALEGKMPEQERRVIESMDRADEILDEMEDDFWVALRSLREKRLIKIVVQRAD